MASRSAGSPSVDGTTTARQRLDERLLDQRRRGVTRLADARLMAQAAGGTMSRVSSRQRSKG